MQFETSQYLRQLSMTDFEARPWNSCVHWKCVDKIFRQFYWLNCRSLVRRNALDLFKYIETPPDIQVFSRFRNSWIVLFIYKKWSDLIQGWKCLGGRLLLIKSYNLSRLNLVVCFNIYVIGCLFTLQSSRALIKLKTVERSFIE